MSGFAFLRPYAQAACRPSWRPIAPGRQAAYLSFYQSACRWQKLSSAATKRTARAADDEPSAEQDRSAMALRIKELTDADARHYPRYQPQAERQSVPEFCAEFASITSKGNDGGRRVELSGRLLSVQRLGAKLMFLQLRDEGAQVQIMCNLGSLDQAVAPAAFKQLARLLRRGDHVAATGRATRTATGALTLDADALPRLLAPGLAPLPARLPSADARAQRRSVDLLVRPAAAATLRLRARLLQTLRAFFEQTRFVEVQTPILAAAAGGAVARPFVTAHDAEAEGTSAGTSTGSRALSLRIAPELWLKRLVVGGLDRVFEIGPAFRNEGVDTTHNPEFTTCEFYAAYWTLPQLMAQTERLLAQLAQAAAAFYATPAGASLQPDTGADAGADDDADFHPASVALCAAGGPFAQLEFVPALEAALGFRLPDLEAPDAYERLRQLLAEHGNSDDDAAGGSLAKLLDRLAGAHLEPQSFASASGPLFITHHPAVMSPLAKSFVCPQTGQRVAARAELFVDGRELANMYEEENDPAEQRRKMQRQIQQQDREDGPAPAVDENYLAALATGLPPTGGWGCGVERLVMLFASRRRIADCLSFGTLRHVVSMR